MRMTLLAWCVCALLSVLWFGAAKCFPNGSVAMSCGNMLPVHEPFGPSNSSPPYTLSASAATYRPGKRITVTLEIKENSSYFEGFLLQARSSTRPDLWPVGEFKDLNISLVTALMCNGKGSSAVSQANNAKRKKVQLTWEAPDNYKHGDVHFRATVIKSYTTFWLNVTSSSLRLENTSAAATAVTSWVVLLLCPLALILQS